MTRLLLVAILFSSIMVLQTGCKKDNQSLSTPTTSSPLPEAMLVPDADPTEYTMANYQDALDDVVYDGDRLIFKNLSHFYTTAMALDSVGDSTAYTWFQNLGFVTSLYDEYDDALENAPEDADQAGMIAYYDNYTNSLVYNSTDETWDVNAMNGTFARLLNSEHKAVIGDNIFYSDIDWNIMVGSADEAQIPTYLAQGVEQEDENAIVKNNRVGLKTTNSPCLPVGFDIFMGDIACGSPASKKSEVRFKVWQIVGWNNQIYTGATITVKHKKRGKFGFGFWSAESRGSQVGGYFEGIYFNQAKIYGNSAKVHEYEVRRVQGNLSSICWHDIQVCVAPMCNGVTLCQNW